MIKVLFVCHGNICRSPMAEYVFKDMIQKDNIADKFYVESAATSTEALGMHIHRGTRNQLIKHNILNFESKTARQMTYQDYLDFDYVLLMDSLNKYNIKYIVREDKLNKIHLLLDYSNNPRDIADPWYTGDFDLTYSDIEEGCKTFLEYIKKKETI